MATKRRTSRVWEFFDEPVTVSDGERDVKKLPCKLCHQQLADGGGTTNLLSHLQAKHSEEYKRCAPSQDRSTGRQTSLASVLQTCSPQRTAAITDRIAEFVARDLCPLGVVDGAGFKQLMNYLEPGYKIPSPSTP